MINIKDYKYQIGRLREYVKLSMGLYPNRIILSVKLRMQLYPNKTFMGMIIETNEDFPDNKILIYIKLSTE